MKYIRTKDGISKLDDDWALFCKEKDIIKQADTIEELCDDVVVKYQNELPIPQSIKNLKQCMKLNHITWEEHFGWLFKRFKEELEWVKLAIRTDKGLIYVAKANDKGEVELL